MKKLLFVPFLVAAGYAQAQITLDQNDFASVGDTVFLATDISVSTLNVGTASASPQTWNFATLGVDGFDTLLFINPATATGGAEFPTATIAMQTSQTTTFFTKTSSDVKILGNSGSAQGFSFAAHYVPAYDILTFPTTNTTVISEVSGFDETEYLGIDTTIMLIGQVKVDSVRFKRDIESDVTFDAFGNITLPIGTYNSLRAYNEQTTNDSIYIYLGAPIAALSLQQGWNTVTPSLLGQINTIAPGIFTGQTIGVTVTRSYDWYAKEIGFRLATVVVNQNDQPQRAEYLSSPAFASITQAELLPSAFVYPNPTASFIAISGISADMQGNINIVDMNGKQVLSSRYTGQSQISIETLANGTYFIQFTDLKGKLVFADKFQVVK